MRSIYTLVLTAVLGLGFVADYSFAAKPVPKAYAAPKKPGTVQKVSYSTVAGTSSAFNASSRLLRIACTTDCWVIVGTTATISNAAYLPIGVVEYVSVSGGATISAIRATADGALSIEEFSDP